MRPPYRAISKLSGWLHGLVAKQSTTSSVSAPLMTVTAHQRCQNYDVNRSDTAWCTSWCLTLPPPSALPCSGSMPPWLSISWWEATLSLCNCRRKWRPPLTLKSFACWWRIGSSTSRLSLMPAAVWSVSRRSCAMSSPRNAGRPGCRRPPVESCRCCWSRRAHRWLWTSGACSWCRRECCSLCSASCSPTLSSCCRWSAEGGGCS